MHLEKLQQALPPPLASTNANGHTLSNHIKLNAINTTPFSGCYKDWTSFKDLFTSLIGNNEKLAPSAKLHYLKWYVQGSAAERIKNLSITDANYKVAWDALTNHYQNERMIINAHMSALFAIPKLTKESASDLENLLFNVTQTLHSLETINQRFESDHVLIYLVASKLDTTTLRHWEQELGFDTAPANWQRLKDFLSTRIRVTQGLDQHKNDSKPVKTDRYQLKSHHVASGDNNSTTKAGKTCPVTDCSESHYIGACPIFKSKQPDKRKKIARQSNLCFNCLGHHHIEDCRSERVWNTCGKRHHTLLHIFHNQRPPTSNSSNGTPTVASTPESNTQSSST